MCEVLCDVIKADENNGRPSCLYSRKLGHRRGINPPSVHCRHVPVSGRQLLLLRVCNTLSNDITVSQMKVTLTDPQQVNRDLEHPDSCHDNKNGETFEIDSMEDLDEENYKNLKIECPRTGLPFTLRPLECHSLHFSVVVKENLEFNFTMELDLQCIMSWSQKSDRHSDLSLFRLPSLRIRKPAMVITALPLSQPKCNEVFQMSYTITNFLQDFLSLRLLWLPEKALQDKQAMESEDVRKNVTRVVECVVCHQPQTKLGVFKLGSTVSILINFHIREPGIYELGQHLKLNMQYAMTGTNEQTVSKPISTHRRTGSNASSQSLPCDTIAEPVVHWPPPRTSNKNTSPAQQQMLQERRDLSPAHSISSVSTPILGSPHKSLGTSPGYLRQPAGFYSVISRTPSNSSLSCTSRAPPACLTPLHVLKRNCQVVVTE